MKTILFALLFIPVIAKSQIISTYAGCGSCSALGDGGPAAVARLDNPCGMVFNSAGDLYIASGTGNRIRKISPLGIITTIAGTGTTGFTGDGSPATAAQLRYPHGMAIDTVGNVFFTDKQNYAIRKIDVATGIITTICGDGSQGYTGDGGPASAAKLFGPESICFDKIGNLYIAENNKHVVRMINTAGIINTIAGIGVNGFSGDGLSATLAQLYFPESVAVDTVGNIFISDMGNSRIRKIDATGVITTFAGNGIATYTGDGLPYTSAQFTPGFIRFDKNGNLYITSTADDRVSIIGTDGVFRTVAGNGIAAHAGDGGAATEASIHNPTDVAFDDCGNLYISSSANNRVRKVTYGGTGTPTITVTGVTTATVGATVTVNAAVSGAGSSYTIKWFKNATLFNTTTVPTTTYTKGAGTDVITARVVPSVLTCYDSATSAGHTITQQTVGLSSVQLGEFQIFPNPVGGILVISGTEAINSVAVTDIMGRVIATLPKVSDKENQVELHLGHLPKGVYFVKVNDWYVQRFLKE